MNLSNAFLIITGAILISILVLINAYISMETRSAKDGITVLREEIKVIEEGIRRDRIELSRLTSPVVVEEFAGSRNFIRGSLRDISILYIRE